MKNPLKKLPDPLVRLLIAFVLVIGGALLVRSMLPSSLKDSALHVRSTIEREKNRPLRFAGSDACADCHEQNTVKMTGYHANLSCETCHGTAMAHTENPVEIKPEAPRKREFCSVCHTFDPSRPTGFPQINPVAHNPLKPCISCHDPHDPKPSSVPEACSACHGEIARTKSISPHALLECTTCHSVAERHKVAPHEVRAGIPAGRQFCGQCHDRASKTQGSPKLDLATHGEKYLCWQCHYPHMPEVR